jgi:hypothetical protein
MDNWFAIGLAVIFGGAFLVIVLQKKAACPHCGKGTVRGLFGSSPCRCDTCGEYARIVAGQSVPIDPGFVAESPTFQVWLRDLAHPEEWSNPWPGRCCVCGAQTARRVPLESHMLTVLTGPHLARVYTLELGCCDECEEPFDSENLNPPAFKEVYGHVPVRFRSYAFWRDFRSRNGKQRK